MTYPRAADEAHEEADEAEQRHERGGTSAATQRRREDVKQRRVDRTDHRELRAHAQRDEHHEEHDGPQRRDGQARHHLRVDDERQARTCSNTVRHTYCSYDIHRACKNDLTSLIQLARGNTSDPQLTQETMHIAEHHNLRWQRLTD